MFDTLKANANSFKQQHPVGSEAVKALWSATVVASATVAIVAVAENINSRRTPAE